MLDNMHSLARQYDEDDVLTSYQSQFFNDTKTIYFDGNSLGKMPLAALSRIQYMMEHQWSQKLIRSWNEDWIEMPNRISEKIAKLLNVDKEEIIICDNTSLNLFKLFFSTLKLQESRNKILIDVNNFPTDQYLLEGLLAKSFTDHKIMKLPQGQYGEASLESIEEYIKDNVALITLSHVLYKSGYLYDMKKINEIAENKGVMIVWDLSHSVGAVPIDLQAVKAKLAVGCTYKYLNGGPGSPAFIYVSKDLLPHLSNPISAWFGHAQPFDFSTLFVESATITKFQTGTPSILSLAPLEISLDIILAADINKLRAKSLQMTNYFIDLVHHILPEDTFVIATPIEDEHRGSHISIAHPEAYRITQALIKPEDKEDVVIIPDFRPPHYIRFGFAPLYNTYNEVYQTVMRIKKIMATREYELHSEKISGVP